MAQWYSRADRARMARGLPPEEKSKLTEEDYRELMELALAEAVARSPAKDMIVTAAVGDLEGKYAGVTRTERGGDGKLSGKYDIVIDWGDAMRERASDPKDGPAYVAQRMTSAFHEVRHVEQRAMLTGDLPVDGRLDMEVVTQMTVNDLYPTVYARGYGNTVSEVDADVCGLEGALAFFEAHPEIKERYGFDFRKQIMRTDEYDVLEDRYQVTRATPEELAAGMREYRDGAYGATWLEKDAGRVLDAAGMTATEKVLMARLESEYGVTWADLEGMDNDERNVLLLRNAREAMDDPSLGIASNLRAYRTGPAITGRFDEILRDENDMLDALREETFGLSDPSGPDVPAWTLFAGGAEADAGTEAQDGRSGEPAGKPALGQARGQLAAARFGSVLKFARDGAQPELM